MVQPYTVPAARHRVEEKIRRSHFITTLAPASTVDEARAFIRDIRAEFDSANHNCWAYLVGPPGSTAQVGMSDDGEPHGTAGRPMLNVLTHSGVGDVAAVVTRYFGGVKLGKGGLARAYSGGVKAALEGMQRVEKTSRSSLKVVIGYSSVTLFQRMLPEYEAEIVAQQFAVDVSYELLMPDRYIEGFTVRLADLTNGQGRVLVGPQV